MYTPLPISPTLPDSERTPEQLVEAYLPRALRIASKWARRRPWLRDEFTSEASYRLWVCARQYTPERGATFWTYALGSVRGGMLDVLRRAAPLGYRRHWGRPEAPPGPIPLTWESPTPEVDDTYQETVEVLAAAIPTGLERELFRGWYTFARSYRCRVAWAGQRYRLKEIRVWQLLDSARQSLRHALPKGLTS